MDKDSIKQSLVTFRTVDGVEMRANLLRFTRYLAVVELHNTASILHNSQVLSDFKIIWQDQTLYAGRAVVRNLVNTDSMMVCEATLSDLWLDTHLLAEAASETPYLSRFNLFVTEWQKLYRVTPEFKVVIADLQTFLTDLRLWLEQVEMEVRAAPVGQRARLERSVVDELSPPVIRAIDAFVERFEDIATGLDEELVPAHQSFLRRQLHPTVLSSPFAHRAFHKPLGYAGDYELVDMMIRPPYEGSTVFAKILNVWLLSQAPAQAHRNRVVYLKQKLMEEALRVKAAGRRARIFNLGCGPAAEVQQFLKEQPLSGEVSMLMLDFNEETLESARQNLEEIRRQNNRGTNFEFIKKSVHHLLKDAARINERPERQFDLVYCAGLFDYLTDQVCKRLINYMYDLLAPGGLLLATNVSDALNRSRPFRYSMEYMLDWHLIYRDAQQFGQLASERAADDNVLVITEDIGVNVFVEVRKPSHA